MLKQFVKKCNNSALKGKLSIFYPVFKNEMTVPCEEAKLAVFSEETRRLVCMVSDI
jgi:hypothetical protein